MLDIKLYEAPNSATAPQHAVLNALDAELSGAHKEGSVTFAGHVFRIRTLGPFEENWATSQVGQVQETNALDFYQAQSCTYAAAALVSIDNVPVEQLFPAPADLPARIKESEMRMWTWYAERALAKLTGRGSHFALPQALFAEYQRLDKSRAAALEALNPLPASTTSGV